MNDIYRAKWEEVINGLNKIDIWMTNVMPLLRSARHSNSWDPTPPVNMELFLDRIAVIHNYLAAIQKNLEKQRNSL